MGLLPTLRFEGNAKFQFEVSENKSYYFLFPLQVQGPPEFHPRGLPETPVEDPWILAHVGNLINKDDLVRSPQSWGPEERTAGPEQLQACLVGGAPSLLPGSLGPQLEREACLNSEAEPEPCVCQQARRGATPAVRWLPTHVGRGRPLLIMAASVVLPRMAVSAPSIGSC